MIPPWPVGQGHCFAVFLLWYSSQTREVLSGPLGAGPSCQGPRAQRWGFLGVHQVTLAYLSWLFGASVPSFAKGAHRRCVHQNLIHESLEELFGHLISFSNIPVKQRERGKLLDCAAQRVYEMVVVGKPDWWQATLKGLTSPWPSYGNALFTLLKWNS